MQARYLFDGGHRALVGVLLLCASTTQAAVTSYAAVLYDDGPSSGLVLVDHPQNVAPASSASSESYAGGFQAAAGYGQAEYGSVHAYATAITSGESTQTRAQGSATWTDVVTISSSAANGPAFARAYFSLSGSLSAVSGNTAIGAVGNSTIAAAVFVGGTKVLEISGQQVSRNGAIETDEKILGQAFAGQIESQPTNTLSGRFAFDIPLALGTPFQLTGSLNAFTQAITSQPGDEASAFSHFGASGYWGGVTEVRLADGTTLTDYTITSLAAVDWNRDFAPTVVPVPAALWLLGTALMALGVRAPHRSTRSASVEKAR